MRTAFFEPLSGASGDMILGAFVDAGMPLDYLRDQLYQIPLSGFALSKESVTDGVLSGTRVSVDLSEDQEPRSWRDIREMLSHANLSDTVVAMATDIFSELAAAEASAHDIPVEDVHFHEVGAVDSIVDICGAAIAVDYLAIDRLYCGAIRTGYGFVRSQHGLLPVPAPATTWLLTTHHAPTLGMPSDHAAVEVELLTPTGAAILTTLATFDQPAMTAGKTAVGFGQRSLPWPNALRIWIDSNAERAPEGTIRSDEGILQIETTIDDMNPQGYELLAERLYEAGAFEVWLTPVIMKKSRPGVVVSTLATEPKREEIERILLSNSPTLGIRYHQVERKTADRQMISVATRFGDVAIKLKIGAGRVVGASPEYDDCLRLARESGAAFQDVWNEAHRLSDPYIGGDPGRIVSGP